MAAPDMASMQFAPAQSYQVGADPSYHVDAKKTSERREGMPDVAPLSAKTLSSYDRYTAWRLRRGEAEPPQPYSKRTSGSLYNFEQE